MKFTYYTKEGKSTCVYGGDVPFGELHRLAGPAAIYQNGTKEWRQNGKLHRIDGAAVEFNDGEKEYYINGKRLDEEEVENWIEENNINLKTKEHQVLFMLRFL